MGDLKYKIGDKVRIKSLDWYEKNKDILCGDILCGEHYFVEGMKKFCSEIFEISDIVVDGYLMLEDIDDYMWTDEMIECKVEEECPQDFIEKYCKSCGTQRCDRTKEFLDGCPHYNEYMCEKQNNDMKEESKPKYEDEVNAETNKIIANAVAGDMLAEKTILECILAKGLLLPKGMEFKDENGNVINATKIVLEKKEKEYPKTYEECINELHIHEVVAVCGWEKEIKALQTLLICRDAYWKIAGEEMGLGKPWEPDWTYNGATKYCIGVSENEIQNFSSGVAQYILAFPTEEMRDAFFNAFRDDIEKCKELI